MKSQDISWKKNINNRKLSSNMIEGWFGFCAKVLLDVICALVFTNAARIMLADVFDWARLSAKLSLKMIIVAVLISVFMEYADYMQKRHRLFLKIIVPVVVVGCCISMAGYAERATHLIPGLKKMASYYIEYWNSYYDTQIFYAAGRTKYVVEALDFITIILFVVFFWMTKLFKKNLIMVVLPVLVLSLELLVGYLPEYNGLVMVFLAVLMANTVKWAVPDFSSAPERKFMFIKAIKNFSWVIVFVILLCSSFVIKSAGAETATKMVAHSAGVKNRIKEIAADLEAVSIGWFPAQETEKNEGVSETAILTNEKQQYKHTVVLQIELEKYPVGRIYLRGFCADTYQNGKWNVNVDGFDKACEDNGYNNVNMSKYVLSLCTRKLYDAYRVDGLEEIECSNDATIKYYEKEDKRVYLPYFIELNTTGLTTEGGALFRKNEELDEVSFLLWDYEGDYRSNLSFSQEGADSDWEKWYREYVAEQYLEVPDNLPGVIAIAETLEQEVQIDYSNQYKKNDQRLKKADLVVQWMSANTDYSTELPELPRGVDPIEYFLGTSRSGYCMHYASASVMILRQMGVPARYVSGYIVKQGAVKAFDDGFYANVKDSNAHAWVEIYLDDIGWVPIEVTKGYGGAASGEVEIDGVTQNAVFSTSSALENITPNEEEITDDAVMDKNNADEDDKLQNDNENADSADSDQDKLRLKIVIVCIFGGALFLAIVIIHYNVSYRNRLLEAIYHKHTRHAIKMINRRIYKRLRYTGKIRKAGISDAEYKEILNKTYTDILAMDWERYMDIVKAAAFSKRAFSVEEMEFCYKLYHKVAEEDRKKTQTRRD